MVLKMNDRQLNYMLRIVKEGSISKAAEVLYVSQPSLSQMVAKIEDELGAKIFVRHTNPLQLTAQGRVYIKACQEIINIQKNMEKEIRDISNEGQGTIHVGIPFQRQLEIIPHFYPQFHQRYPRVDLKIEEYGSSTLEKMALDRQFDFIFLTTTPKDNDLNYILVAKEEIVLLAAKDSEIAKRIPNETSIEITEAKNERFINIKKGHSIREIQERLFAEKHLNPEVLFEVGMIEVAKQVIPVCGGVMLSPRNYIDISKDIVEKCHIYPIKGIEQERHFYICYHKKQYLPQYIKYLINLFVPDYDFKED